MNEKVKFIFLVVLVVVSLLVASGWRFADEPDGPYPGPVNPTATFGPYPGPVRPTATANPTQEKPKEDKPTATADNPTEEKPTSAPTEAETHTCTR